MPGEVRQLGWAGRIQAALRPVQGGFASPPAASLNVSGPCQLTVGKTVLRQCLYRVHEARSAPRPLPQGQAGAEVPGHREHNSSPSIS